MQIRNYKMDNIRFIMIIGVLIGHFIELYDGEFVEALYKIIYSFHIPVLIFISGYFAKYSRRKLFFIYLYTYVIFQVMYLVFDNVILMGQQEITFQFTTPYWLLWYIFVMILFYLCLPIMEEIDLKGTILLFGVCCFLSIIMGFDNSLGYYLSLMRFFTFLPYFVLGVILHKDFDETKIENRKCKKGLIFVLTSIIFLCSYYLILNTDITNHILYGSYTYLDLNYSPIIKIFLLCLGLLWIVFWVSIIPNRKIPLITSLGQHTYAIFLMHGFIVKLAKKYTFFCYSQEGNFILTLILTVLIVFVFGNRFVAETFEYIFTGKWLDKMWYRISRIK